MWITHRERTFLFALSQHFYLIQRDSALIKCHNMQLQNHLWHSLEGKLYSSKTIKNGEALKLFLKDIVEWGFFSSSLKNPIYHIYTGICAVTMDNNLATLSQTTCLFRARKIIIRQSTKSKGAKNISVNNFHDLFSQGIHKISSK